VLFSEPKIPQQPHPAERGDDPHVSVLFSEPKIPQSSAPRRPAPRCVVSVLFSEPKIPQARAGEDRQKNERRFSALQRAENSSTINASITKPDANLRFSALQRAENSSTGVYDYCRVEAVVFQCSSASRKFLNRRETLRRVLDARFQCSSASRKFLNPQSNPRRVRVGRFQCSSASRKFLKQCRKRIRQRCQVSVLFSEPKIPQVCR